MNHKEISPYQGIPGIDAGTEQQHELERGAIAAGIVSNWEQTQGAAEADLTAVAPLLSAIREQVTKDQPDHNDHYMNALVHEFVASTTKLQLNATARQHLDSLLDELLERYKPVEQA